jgi:hypothetical protein
MSLLHLAISTTQSILNSVSGKKVVLRLGNPRLTMFAGRIGGAGLVPCGGGCVCHLNLPAVFSHRQRAKNRKKHRSHPWRRSYTK